jgi:hypothetical protein
MASSPDVKVPPRQSVRHPITAGSGERQPGYSPSAREEAVCRSAPTAASFSPSDPSLYAPAHEQRTSSSTRHTTAAHNPEVPPPSTPPSARRRPVLAACLASPFLALASVALPPTSRPGQDHGARVVASHLSPLCVSPASRPGVRLRPVVAILAKVAWAARRPLMATPRRFAPSEAAPRRSGLRRRRRSKAVCRSAASNNSRATTPPTQSGELVRLSPGSSYRDPGRRRSQRQGGPVRKVARRQGESSIGNFYRATDAADARALRRPMFSSSVGFNSRRLKAHQAMVLGSLTFVASARRGRAAGRRDSCAPRHDEPGYVPDLTAAREAPRSGK